MNTRPLLGVLGMMVGAAAIAAAAGSGKAAGRPRALIEGTSLDAWEHVLADPAVRRDQVWSVREGTIVCLGTPIGVLYTKSDYTNFRLELEYRWAPGTKPGNSGIMSRLQPGTGALPRTVEVQLQHGNAGDVIGLQGFPIASGGQPAWFEKDSKVAGKISGVKRKLGAEKPAGEWNRVEVEARGGKYKVTFNGQVVNELSGVEVRPGRIGLQSEGGEVHFRNVQLTAL